jgi:hypothetical protein
VDGTSNGDETRLERILMLLMLLLFWAAFLCLVAGLGLWLLPHGDAVAAGFLRVGLIGLIALPVLRLVLALATAARTRDGILLAATVAVLAIVWALTLRDAASP